MNFPRIDTFKAPNRNVSLDIHSDTNGWGDSQLWARWHKTQRKEKLADYSLPMQGSPLWSADSSIAVIHKGTMSMGIWPEVYELNESGSRLLQTLEQGLIWEGAKEAGLLHREFEPFHIYVHARVIDNASQTVWSIVSGNGSLMRVPQKFTNFAVGFKWTDGSLVYAEKMPLQGVHFIQIRMASEEYQGAGTGFIISSDGFVVTCAHVIRGATNVQVYTSEETFHAQIVFCDEDLDLALLQLSSQSPLNPICLGNSNAATLGQQVFTIGYPNPTLQGFNEKFTRGEISSLSGIDDDLTSFQISVPVQPGNSGGALSNEDGKVIGIVNSKLDTFKITGDISQNVNYAIKVEKLIELLEKNKIQFQPPPDTSDGSALERLQRATVRIVNYGWPESMMKKL